MSTIKIRQPHEFDHHKAKECLGSFADMMAKYGVSLDWTGDRATIKGIGVSGEVSIHDTFVEVIVKLGMLAKAAGVDPTRLEGSITRRLNAAFTPTTE